MSLNRSWHDYSESLIERGRILIDVSFLKSSKEIKKMNKGKVGAPYQYSDSYVEFLAFLKIGFKIPYRMVQGIVRGLSEYVKIVEEIHFTHIRRRMIKIKPSIGNDSDTKEPITLVVDASGLTVSKKGDFIEERWIRKKKEFIKLHIAADAKSKKVVSFRITRGNVHDAKKFCPLVRESFKKYNIDRVYADKAHDNRRNFNLLERLDIEPVIAIRNNATTKERGCQLRTGEVLLIKKLGYQRWRHIKEAGRRWIAEIVFSSIKRVLGEDLFSKKFTAQKVEASMKILLCKLAF